MLGRSGAHRTARPLETETTTTTAAGAWPMLRCGNEPNLMVREKFQLVGEFGPYLLFRAKTGLRATGGAGAILAAI